mmetsp:Transcript_9253/g.19221  ORF Transcript_9253/g.19221 Transcript_9253/m.19221 type:complete len:141 (-) Transcript_9253:506-928(-)|eukprot:CAMPEP_0172441622 /NCGR_PEP_ID=MMETSP1065-20121228/2143_1 /TAXON_ID=265537 /ORGANISM="Amphiprora paludosa, Strain CCMP125" /LENGTH=140 /DNA_ID=CAMNT_0013191077 /DNA_START=55 /DNA_END=477 /DNA_ORIENTATION=+
MTTTRRNNNNNNGTTTRTRVAWWQVRVGQVVRVWSLLRQQKALLKQALRWTLSFFLGVLFAVQLSILWSQGGGSHLWKGDAIMNQVLHCGGYHEMEQLAGTSSLDHDFVGYEEYQQWLLQQEQEQQPQGMSREVPLSWYH